MIQISLSSCSSQEEEYRDLVSISQSMEEQYGQYFDSVIPFEEVFVASRHIETFFFSSRPLAGADFEEMPDIFADMLSTCFNLSFVAKEVDKFKNFREKILEPLPFVAFFSFGHCPNEGGKAPARIKKYNTFIYF